MQAASITQRGFSAAVAQRHVAPQQRHQAIGRAPVPRRCSVAVRAEGEQAAPGIETQGPNMKALKDIQVSLRSCN